MENIVHTEQVWLTPTQVMHVRQLPQTMQASIFSAALRNLRSSNNNNNNNNKPNTHIVGCILNDTHKKTFTALNNDKHEAQTAMRESQTHYYI